MSPQFPPPTKRSKPAGWRIHHQTRQLDSQLAIFAHYPGRSIDIKVQIRLPDKPDRLLHTVHRIKTVWLLRA
jgi:hypothetical protein